MRFVAYIDRKPTMPPPPDRVPGEPTIIDVDPDARFEDAAKQAVNAAGLNADEFYYWPHLLVDVNEPNPEYVRFPEVGIAEDGQFLWTRGARDRVTLADLERARQRGFTIGDPAGVWLELPSYGDGFVWGWEDFFKWLIELGLTGAVAIFVGILRKLYKRWVDRGAATPLAFLDIVLARDEWNESDLAQLLGLNSQEASELLTSMGFEEDADRQDRWIPSTDSQGSALRRVIIEDFLYQRDSEHDEGEDDQKDRKKKRRLKKKRGKRGE